MTKLKLNQLDKNIKSLILVYLITLGVGMTFGLGYVYLTSEMNPSGMVEQYLGNHDEWEPKLPKTIIDLVSHAHDHITMFSIIFLSIGLIFNQNSVVEGLWKKILMIEPFFSIIITFTGFFILRYITSQFAYIIMLSSGLMYICFYTMLFISIYDLLRN
ncbi:MAG: hypothetical protein CMG67_03190 [Candidatus Marinimicrobia bacterium]|nr:hypothetical protein [Candidatus Neomarinimicrobiota bacterium]|tara:strand:+ start:11423 stop:11899 length:477 start_codon:yes stop_codon:yes gene_type:complete